MVAPTPTPISDAPDADTSNVTPIRLPDPARKLTRSQVADQLGISISTVRRLEGTRLHPEISPEGVRLFDPAQVHTAAASLARATAPATAPTPAALSRGELVARIFERFEQRYSLPEIVIDLRVAPDLVRELFHQWRVGLEQGEARRTDSVPPATDVRTVSERELQDLLGDLPNGRPTRISVARVVGEHAASTGSVLDVVELGGFIVTSPTTQAALVNRYGWGRFRITASDPEAHEVLWEVATPFL